MTLPLLLIALGGARPPSLLEPCILAAFRLDPAARRIVALSFLHELLRAGAPSRETLRAWSQLGCLLTRCAAELGEDARAADFSRLARNAHDLWEAALVDLAAQRQRAFAKRPRVLEAVCAEVA